MMNKDLGKELNKQVNSSGFPLQIGLLDKINSTQDKHVWKVFLSEHPWKNNITGNSGFIDIVLIDKNNTQIMVVECKRVLDSDWIFLHHTGKKNDRRHVRFWLTSVKNDNTQYFNCHDSTCDPSSPEVEYCIVPKKSIMLETFASELVEATEALALEDYKLHRNDRDRFIRFYFSIIVTTAKLQICKFNPKDISIEEGIIKNTTFETVPFVRFRKSLTTQSLSRESKIFSNIEEVARENERTIFIINSSNFIEVLLNWDFMFIPRI